MDATEKIARTLHHIESGQAHLSEDDAWNGIHPLDREEYRAIAKSLLAAFPQVALEGREEMRTFGRLAINQPTRRHEKRTVWESPWSEVQS